MARIRTIKPEFFTSEDIVELSPLARLLYIALWCEADREGRLEWKPKTFKIRYLPMDDCDIEALLAEITDRGLVVRYTTQTTQTTQTTTQSAQTSGTQSGQEFGYIPAFTDHQFINNKEAQSVLPEPKNQSRPRREKHATTTRNSPDVNALSLKGKERKGKEGKGKHATSPIEYSRPTIDECKEYALETFNLNGSFATDFFAKYTGNGWIGSDGSEVKNWKNLMRNWANRLSDQQRKALEPKHESKPLTTDEIGNIHGWRDED